MKWHLEVDPGIADFKITHKDDLCLLGSCFANHLSGYLKKSGFRVASNPLGVVFNPLSLASAMSDNALKNVRFAYNDGKWHALDAHGSFKHEDKTTLLNKVLARKLDLQDHLKFAKVLVITWGTAQVWEWNEDRRVVANCHKIPQDRFKSRFLEVDEIVELWQEILERIFHINTDLRVVLTVSPVRYTRGGMASNSLSKGILHQASRKLTQIFEDVYYFPSYEIVTDELRDYRFFKKDMIHPNDMAVQHVFDKFQSWCMPQRTVEISRKIQRLNKRLDHRFETVEQAEMNREEVEAAIESVLGRA